MTKTAPSIVIRYPEIQVVRIIIMMTLPRFESLDEGPFKCRNLTMISVSRTFSYFTFENADDDA